MTTPSSTDSVEAGDGDEVLEVETETDAETDAATGATADTEPAGGFAGLGSQAGPGDALDDEIIPELVEDEDDYLDDGDPVPDEGRGGGIATGAAAIVAAGLAVSSLSDNWLGNILAQRQTLIGQINTANSAADAIIKQRYTEPWHKTALVGIWFAVAAMLVAAGTLFVGEFFAKREAPVWVRALTWGALALGIVGLGVSAAMYFDVFTSTISVPAGAATSSGQ